MASDFWVGSISYSSWMTNKLGRRIMVIGSTSSVFLLFYSQPPLYKHWGGPSFFVSLIHWGTRAKNYEIHSYMVIFFFSQLCFNQVNKSKNDYELKIIDENLNETLKELIL